MVQVAHIQGVLSFGKASKAAQARKKLPANALVEPSKANETTLTIETTAPNFASALKTAVNVAKNADMGLLEVHVDGPAARRTTVFAGGDAQNAVHCGHPSVDIAWNLHAMTTQRRSATWSGLSCDGRWAALGDDEGLLRVYDLEEGRLKTLLRGHRSAVIAGSWHPTHPNVLWTVEESPARLFRWDIGEGLIQKTKSTGTRSVHPSRNGRWIMLAQWKKGDAPVLDGDSLETVAVLGGHKGAVWPIAACPGGDSVLTCDDTNTIRRWNVGEGWALEKVLRRKRSTATLGRVQDMAFVPQSTMVMLQEGQDSQVFLDWEQGVVSTADKTPPGEHLRFHPGGKEAVGAGASIKRAGGAVFEEGYVVDVQRSRVLHTINPARLHAHWRHGHPEACFQTQAGLVRHSTSTGQRTQGYEGNASPLHGMAFSPDGEMLATCGGADRSLMVWSASTSQRLFHKALPQGHFHDVCWHPQHLLARSSGVTHGHLHRISPDLTRHKRQLKAASTAFGGLTISHCGEHVLVSHNGGPALYSLQDFKRVLRLKRPSQPGGLYNTISLSLCPDGTRAVATLLSGNLAVWPLQDNALAHIITPPEGISRPHALIGDVVLACTLHGIEAYQIDSGAHVGSHPTEAVPTRIVSHKNRVAVCFEDLDRVLLIDDPLGTGEQRWLYGPNASCAAFSPDGGRLAVGGFDGSVVVWRV